MANYKRWMTTYDVKKALEYEEHPTWSDYTYIKVHIQIDDEDLLKVLKEE